MDYERFRRQRVLTDIENSPLDELTVHGGSLHSLLATAAAPGSRQALGEMQSIAVLERVEISCLAHRN